MSPQNVTPASAPQFTSFQHRLADDEWKYSQAANVILLLLGTWYVVALVIHLKRRQAFHQYWNQFDENSMLRTMLYSGVFYLIRVMSSGLIIHVPFMTFQTMDGCNRMCEVCNDVSILAYGIAQFLIYLYLWFQMKVYYDKQDLAERSPAFVTLIWACFVLLFGGFTTIAVVWMYPDEHMCSNNGCVIKCNTCSKKVYALATFLVALTMQLFILALIVTVLCKQMASVDKTKKRLEVADESEMKLRRQDSTSSQRITILLQARLVRALKKLVCCAFICMLSDICMLTIATKLVPSYFSRGISNIPYEVTLLVNMFTMVCTFNEPLAVLFPFLRKGDEDQLISRAKRGSIRIKI